MCCCTLLGIQSVGDSKYVMNNEQIKVHSCMSVHRPPMITITDHTHTHTHTIGGTLHSLTNSQVSMGQTPKTDTFNPRYNTTETQTIVGSTPKYLLPIFPREKRKAYIRIESYYFKFRCLTQPKIRKTFVDTTNYIYIYYVLYVYAVYIYIYISTLTISLQKGKIPSQRISYI